MTSKNNTTSTTDATLLTAPTAGRAALTKLSPTLDVKSNFLNPLGPYPTAIIVLASEVPRNTPIPVATNNSVDPTEALKTVIKNTIEAIPFLIAPISYEPETVLLQLEYLKQELNYDSANYKSAVPHPKKHLLIAIDAPLKILTRHLQYHQTHSSPAPNLNPDLKSEAILKLHSFHTANNNIADTVPPPTPGVFINTAP